MKIIERKIGDFFFDKASKPIRDKKDAILLLLETLKLINTTQENISNSKGKFIIYVDKMSRIFYETSEKFFSLYFPFALEEQEDNYFRIYDTLTELDITHQMISLLISIVNGNEKLESSLENVMDFIIESAEDYEYDKIDDIWKILYKLWQMEDGYIRFDHDPVHEKARLHPLCHLDINYCSGATYKIGLKHPLAMEEFRNILDVATDCSYLEYATY